MPIAADDLLTFATPATLAVNASRGRWEAAAHLRLIDEAVCDAIARRVPERILVIEVPPRHGKSMLISKYTTAWHMLTHTDSRVMLASHTATIAKHWGREARDVVRRFGPPLGVRIRRDVSAANFWRIEGFEGGMITAGVGGPLVGHGADLLVIDDYIKNDKQAMSERFRDDQWSWFQSVAWTRLSPDGVCIVMATRWHEDDLIGRILNLCQDEFGVQCRRVRLPAVAEANDLMGRHEGDALWPEHRSLRYLAEQRQVVGRYYWNAQFQQQPTQHEDAEFPPEYFSRPFWCEEEQWPTQFDLGVVAIDPCQGKGKAGDFAGIVFLGFQGGVWYVDAVVERLAPPAIVDAAIDLAISNGAEELGIETNAFQFLFRPMFAARMIERRVLLPVPLGINNDVNKHQRIRRLSKPLELHLLRFRRNRGTLRLVQQLKEFPTADHDDGPDALEMADRLWHYVRAAQGERDAATTARGL